MAKSTNAQTKVNVEQSALAEIVDKLFQTREQRYALQHEIKKLEELESACRIALIKSLPKFGATGLAGRYARAQLETKQIVRVEDWSKLYAFIKKKNAFDLLQRRVSDTAVKARWEEKDVVPGTVPDRITVVSLSKLK